MCGIAGQIGLDQNKIRSQYDIYIEMQKSMRRRGPDQHGIYINGSAALIHSRLCVIDIETGRQPMMLEHGDNRYSMVYNGELYNTEELRHELKQKGHKFKGYSDTEVLLHSYAEWKEDCLNKFNGIFAFAIWEEISGKLFIARDRIGVKPLFYTKVDNDFLFASEIKTLLCNPQVKPELDSSGLYEIMFIGPGHTPGRSVFRNIYELLPGEYGYYDAANGKLEKHTYWKLEDSEHKENFQQTVEKVRFMVLDAIERQLVSDVPVGTFLSGGLDSSIISSVANSKLKKEGRKLYTLSVDYKDNAKYFRASKFQPSSDSEFIMKMNSYLNAEHHLIMIDTPELVKALYNAVDARDVPGMADVDSSLLLFCEKVKDIATVALSGECADEIFGGYPWYRDKNIREQDGFPWAQSTAYRMEFLRPEFIEKIDPFEYVDCRYRETVENSSVLSGTNPLETRMKQMMNLNLKWFMQTLLDRKDRMSMYNGLEVRVPFCDYRIAEYLYTVPWEYKDYKGIEKGLLREAMTGYLPDEVLWRKKSPYPKTHNPSYMKAVSDELKNIIDDPSSPIFDFIKKESLLTLIETDNPVPWYGQLMTTPQTIAYFIQFNYWLSKYKVKYVE